MQTHGTPERSNERTMSAGLKVLNGCPFGSLQKPPEKWFSLHTHERSRPRLPVQRFLGETAGWASAWLLLSPSSHPFSRLALRKHGSHFENSSCLINDVYTGISVSSSSSWSVLFSCLLCSNPADRWFCRDKCKVCISHVTAGQPIITVHFPWLCKPL